MDNDISKTSLAVMLILAMLISVLSTLTIMGSLEKTDYIPKKEAFKVNNDEVGSGSINLKIVREEQPEPQPASVSLEIKRNGD